MANEAPYDVAKLCRAIAEHETHNCRDKTNSTAVNNCHGIRTWKNGVPHFKRFASRDGSYTDCERIWTAYYGRFPDLALAKKWSGNDKAQSWLNNVTHFYNTL